MDCSDIYRNFWSRVRFGVRVGSQELHGLIGGTCAELGLTGNQVTRLSPELLNKDIFSSWRKKKSNKKTPMTDNLIIHGQIAHHRITRASKKWVSRFSEDMARQRERGRKGRLPKIWWWWCSVLGSRKPGTGPASTFHIAVGREMWAKGQFR